MPPQSAAATRNGPVGIDGTMNRSPAGTTSNAATTIDRQPHRPPKPMPFVTTNQQQQQMSSANICGTQIGANEAAMAGKQRRITIRKDQNGSLGIRIVGGNQVGIFVSG